MTATVTAHPAKQKAPRKPNRLFGGAYPYASVLPALLVIVLFTIYPVFYAVRISFYQYVLTKPNSHPFIGLKNFHDVITSYYFTNSLINTGIYTLASVTGVLLFGLMVALLLNTKMRSVNALK